MQHTNWPNHEQQRYLAHFQDGLPRYPYASDDPSQGIRIQKRENALMRTHIQVGHYPHAVLRLVVDVDMPWPLAEEKFRALPPSLMLINPESRHFHGWYELLDPIPLSVPPERQETLRATLSLLARVEAQLEAFYGADPGYTGLLSRNPLLHPSEWTWGGGKRWSLRGLTDELQSLSTPRVPRPEASSYGRNVSLFDQLRGEAYGHVSAFRGVSGGWEAFRNWVFQRAHALNQRLFRDHPKGVLDAREVEHTAKSIARWTWEKYRGTRVWVTSSTGRPDRSRLSPDARDLIPPLGGRQRQEALRAGGKQRGSQRRQEAEKKLTEALQRLQAKGRVTARALAREAGVDKKTASKWLKEMLTEALQRLQARGRGRVTARALAREAGVDKKTASKWMREK